MNGFIDHLYTQLGTISNYRSLADLHTLQITTTHAKPFPAVPWQWFLTVEILQLRELMFSCHSRPCRIIVNCQLVYSDISTHPP
jgi:hypothetical protein